MATTFPVEQGPQTSFRIQHSSPLDSLVRRTSAKRTKAVVVQSATSQQSYPTSLLNDYSTSLTLQTTQDKEEEEEEEDPYGGYAKETSATPLHSFLSQQPPNSPLLHSHFARNSAATASVNGTLSDLRSSVGSRNVYQELGYRYHDDESVYSQTDPPFQAIRDSWRSETSSTATARPYDPAVPSSDKPLGVPATSSSGSATSSHWASAVPTVVVSSPDVENNTPRAGRASIVRPITSNFSRPVRPPSQSQSPQRQRDVTAPPLPHYSEEQKRCVLERNVNRTTPQPQSQEQMKFFRRTKSPVPNKPNAPVPNPYLGTTAERLQQQPISPTSPVEPLLNPHTEPTTTATTTLHNPTPLNPYLGPAPHIRSFQRTSSPQPLDQRSDQRSPQPPLSSPQSNINGQLDAGLNPVALLRNPPVRSDSPASLYSAYSYYNYESAASSPSPVNATFSGPPFSKSSPAPQSPSSQPHGPKRLQPTLPEGRQRSRFPHHKSRTPSPVTPAPSSPQDFLQLGIQHHETNRLGEAALYFEKSAKEDGGCGVGMLMWGLTLRHGWGCEKNEKVGFKWLRKAAESAVVDLESARGGKGVDTAPVQDELVLAIYEVGQCFFHGWGVNKDQKMAVSYYTVAARLGDPDAQNDLAFCLANGKGCKKDRKEAAKWYRAAVAQGVSDVGLAWIYKEKFM